jgi:hypothetical protein
MVRFGDAFQILSILTLRRTHLLIVQRLTWTPCSSVSVHFLHLVERQILYQPL